MHVDAASGGFVVPFSHPELPWDLRCERVAFAMPDKNAADDDGRTWGLEHLSAKLREKG